MIAPTHISLVEIPGEDHIDWCVQPGEDYKVVAQYVSQEEYDKLQSQLTHLLRQALIKEGGKVAPPTFKMGGEDFAESLSNLADLTVYK